MRMCAAGENKSNIAIHKKMDEFENGKYSMKKLLKETTNDVFSQVAKAYVVGIPKEHPLCRDNKIKYICMARGPNMNENRDECLHGDYAIGERMLKATYESMFNAIAQIYRKQYKGENHQFPVYQQPTGVVPRPKYGFRNALLDYCDPGKGILRTLKAELECRVFHRNNCLGTVCIYDAFPKSKIHLLVIPLRRSGLAVDNIKDLKRKHLKNLKLFHAYGKQVATYLSKSKPSTFPIKLGYHAIPSLNRLHLHIISQDFDSLCLKNKKHWNSFTQTGFFMSPQIIENHLEKEGNLANLLMNAKDLMNLPLACNRCKATLKNMPKLKEHLRTCSFPFSF
mmetsp:Transcript_33770/g.41585  ORF Transcript_33770/g.41585 Transcript_33770/m.41585 type:complete len:338 (+) Transcript_33770:186-1199(+)